MSELDDISISASTSDSRKSVKQKNFGGPAKIGPNHELTLEQKADLKLAFDSFDSNGTGWIGLEELRVAISALGYETKMDQLRAMLAEVDKDAKGKISFDDFLHIIAGKMSQKDTKEEILKSFRLIDVSNTGNISFEDLQRVTLELGEDLNDEELQEMIQEASSKTDEPVSFEEFININKKYGGLQVHAYTRHN
ncbi:uncharacterized protein LOC129943223 [Eupeodes corollae]|uniref:uncharacterized protein LOC129943223 n=1 Tax=Eupeodes corollae TaxID=290404 RepID=UPI002492CC62|nr:uncharacterized protein LOC129943223 [Eupeodes corollae]